MYLGFSTLGLYFLASIYPKTAKVEQTLGFATRKQAKTAATE